MVNGQLFDQRDFKRGAHLVSSSGWRTQIMNEPTFSNSLLYLKRR
jgi:hypothetical protein